jgi:hypothetical protein
VQYIAHVILFDNNSSNNHLKQNGWHGFALVAATTADGFL